MEPNIRTILENSSTIAVYGMSRDSWKPAHTVPSYLMRQGYTVVPINPFTEEILGEKSYPDLESVPHTIDILNVFRPSEQALGIVEEAVRRKQDKGDISVIWLQLGIVNSKAKELAEAHGITFVQNRCIYVDHKLSGVAGKQQ